MNGRVVRGSVTGITAETGRPIAIDKTAQLPRTDATRLASIFGVADQALDSALDSLIRAMAARDLLTTLAWFSSGHAPAVLGSEAGEAAVGRAGIEAFFRRIYDRPASFRFDFPERSWTVRGDVAWLTADGSVVEPDAAGDKPYRLTAIFVREEGVWKLALWSGAEPVQSTSSAG